MGIHTGLSFSLTYQGLRRYGYNKEADRISANFLSLILKEFIQHNTIVEMYDVERRESEVSAGLRFGYKSNEIGFGWTNAAFVELYAQLPEREKQNVLKLEGVRTLTRYQNTGITRRNSK